MTEKARQISNAAAQHQSTADDDWVVCALCEEEVLAEDARTCDSGEDICPACWAEVARVEH